MVSLKGVLAAFSPRGDQFAVTTGDGRVKTWDVASGALSSEFNEIAVDGQSALAPKGHLGLEYKCLAWGSASPGTKKSKKKASLIALGTAGGDVIAWNPILGELKWRANDCNAGGVNSVCFVKGQASLFCAGADGMVCELDLDSGKILTKFRASKSPVTSLSVSPDGTKLLAAASELKLFDMETKKRKRKFTGHASCVTATTFTGDGQYLLSGAVEDTQVAVWECEGSGKGAKLVLTLEHPAMALHTWGFGRDDESSLRILAVSEAGEAYVWSGASVEELGRASPLRVSVGARKGKGVKQAIILGRVTGAESVLLARGVALKPSFESVALGEPGNIVLPPLKSSLLSPQRDEATDPTSRSEVTVLGADNAADAALGKILQPGEVKKRKRRNSVEEPESVPEKDDDAMEAAPIVEDDGEQTMEERLLALGLLDERVAGEGNAPENAQVVPPKSDSLDVLLAQALRSEDNALLEQCFSVSDEKIISNTIRRLTPADACTLLRLAIAKLEARPRKGLQFLPWIQVCLLENASYIMSNYQARRVLKPLHRIIEARLHTFRPLLTLSGRLNLIMAKVNASEKMVEEPEEAQVPAVYEEGDESDEEEVEDAMQEYEEEDEDDSEGAPELDDDGDDDPMQQDHAVENGGSFSDDDDSE